MDLSQLEDFIHIGDVTEACPYLEHRVSTLRFANGLLGAAHYRQLLDRGYRRNGIYMYRPECAICRECKILRVPLDTFRMNKEQRRVWRKGQRHFSLHIAPPVYAVEKADLYARYLRHQHATQRTQMDPREYERFLVDTCLGGNTFELQLRVEGTLVGLGLLDRAEDILSSVYFYFAPEAAPWSPGTYSALAEIELARSWGLSHYYLGYHIAGCPSMAYKQRFRPCEIKDVDGQDWHRLP